MENQSMWYIYSFKFQINSAPILFIGTNHDEEISHLIYKNTDVSWLMDYLITHAVVAGRHDANYRETSSSHRLSSQSQHTLRDKN